MELPNYFLVDLPDQSALTHQLVVDACRTLKQNRERFLLPRSTDSIIQVLATLARDWLDSEYPFRKLLLEQGAERTGFRKETLEHGLDQFFRQMTRENLERLVLQDLGHSRRLDEIVSDDSELKENRASIAQGAPLIVHFTGGLLPNPTLTSICLGLLVRSAQFVKCASTTSFVPRLFAHSLYTREPKLASCLEVAEWKGGTELLDSALYSEANCVTATGSDETLMAIRTRLPARARFVAYGHRLSFGFIARESLGRLTLEQVLQAAAEDVAAWNQLGCLSPHVIYVETGGALAPQEFAEQLATTLAAREKSHPRGAIADLESAAIATRRMVYEVRASEGGHTKIWSSEGSTAWTVVYEDDPQFQLSCLNRFIYVKAVADPEQMLNAAATVQGKVSTVGISAPSTRALPLATQMARWGATRICRLGEMQNPPLTWRHDGRPALGDLLTWSDFEF